MTMVQILQFVCFVILQKEKKNLELFMSLQGHRDLPAVWPQLNIPVIVY